jgi:hypothetical protein
MSRYRVTVFERIVKEYELEVEADNAAEAKRTALARFGEDRRWPEPEESNSEIDCEVELIKE